MFTNNRRYSVGFHSPVAPGYYLQRLRRSSKIVHVTWPVTQQVAPVERRSFERLSELRLSFGTLGINRFGGLKSDLTVGAVTEWFV